MVKQDLRFERTEKSLEKAFLRLLQTKEMAKISVKELCQEAQVSRNAFYQHYETKEHLYESLLQKILLSMEEACRPVAKDIKHITPEENRLFLDNILQAVAYSRFIIEPLLISQPASFTAAFHQMIIATNLDTTRLSDVSVDPAAIHVFAGAIVSFVSYWILETDLTLNEAQDKLFSIVGQMQVGVN